MFGKRKLAALGAEFLGTAVLAFTFLSVSRSTIGIPYFVSLAAGIAVILMGLALVRDVHLNPAYTFALWTARKVRTLKAAAFIVVQLLGGWAAYGLYKYLSQGEIQPLASEFDSRLLVAEALGAFVFAFVASGVLFQRVHWLIRAVTVGGGFALGILVASAASNGFINPAIALASNGWSWGTTVLGPVLGAIIGVNLYGLLFAFGAPVVAADKAVKADRKVAKAETAVEEKVAETREKVAAKSTVAKAKTEKAKPGRKKRDNKK